MHWPRPACRKHTRPARASSGTIVPDLSDGGIVEDQGPIDFLLGTWIGEGAGDFPSMEPFVYEEEIGFAPAGGPVLRYTQRAWRAGGGDQLHTETGLWLAAGELLTVSIALPAVSEVCEGTVRGSSILLKSIGVTRSAAGPPLVATRRAYRLEGSVLSYDIEMATSRVGLTRHVWGSLVRTA